MKWKSLSNEERNYWNSFEKESQQRVLLSQAVEAFGEDLERVLKEKLQVLSQEHNHLSDLKTERLAALWRIFERENLLGDDFSREFVRMWLKYKYFLKLETTLLKKQKEIRSCVGAYNLMETKQGKRTELNVEAAVAVPLEYVFPNALRKSGTRLIGLCPFHLEKTPSFIIYTENNSFFCFGCKEGGDVINFVMKLDNLDFVDAVRRLA